MLKLIVICLLFVSTSLGVKITYPEVRRDASVVDEYLSGSVKMSDPYRWLEDPHSEETKKFVEAQNKVTDNYLTNDGSDKSLKSGSVRGEILKALTEAYSYTKYTLPVKKGSHYFYFMNTGLQNHNVLYVRDRYPVNGRKGKADDGTGTEALLNQKVYYHRVGTNQAEDILVAEFPDHPTYFMGDFEVSRNEKYLFVLPEIAAGMNSFYYARLDGVLKTTGIREKLTFVPVIDNFEDNYEYITNDDSIVYLKTNKGAPNYRIVAIDLNKPQEIYWSTIVPESPSRVLIKVNAINEDKLLLRYLEGVKSKLEVRYLGNGSYIQEIPVEIGSIDEISGDRGDDEIFFNLVSFLTPGLSYRLNMTKQPYEPELYREIKSKSFDASKFITKQVFYKSKDGTRVPMFIVHKKDFVPRANSPTYLYGYGGYGINILPSFVAAKSVFIQNFDGVYAVANIRGGGEYGKKWHEGGQVLNKQNGFDDFQAAAQYLYNEKYTTPSKLFINGRSNGGFLVAACVNQRPDMFGAAVAQVGVYDMLRFQKFTMGHGSCPEFGCSDSGNATVFQNLKKLSPLHNVRVPEDPKVQYPAVLLITGDHDDRALPLHSYKFAAELQYAIGRSERQTNPLLLKISTKTGHGQGKPTSALIEEYADIYTFLARALDFNFTA